MSENEHLQLSRKYRPKTFDEIYGNEDIIDSLKAKSKEKKITTFLITGPKGCGKSSISRILASQYTDNPNGLIEIVVSDKSGVDTARDINKQAKRAVLGGGAKVFVLNEVHESSKKFQQAILSSLEEPPKNVYFILVTTHPEKLIPTVKSRCMAFNVELLPPSVMTELLEFVCEEEDKEVDDDILEMIAEKTEGTPREALMLLDQVIDLPEKKALKVVENYSFIDENNKEIIELCRAMINKKSKYNEIMNIFKDIKDEPESIRRAVLGYCGSILLKENNPRAALIIMEFEANVYDSGRAGLIGRIFNVFSG